MLKFDYYSHNLTLFRKYTTTREVFVYIFKFYSEKMYIKHKTKLNILNISPLKTTLNRKLYFLRKLKH
ncbi:Uncharacterised protein [Myroides odoratimimus]|uniref:Uncharacterized protein n=1 Tax=Myroides odoratimimus CCUG 10230 TaxID=883150 RepID=A0ABP2NB36_9FLAO|nr:hypothetical protein HMPREF9712_01713 [Myroides odoratimimus CCUG 10230]STZ49300.1 Uncharacterised protein [Myroides odoratimimus]